MIPNFSLAFITECHTSYETGGETRLVQGVFPLRLFRSFAVLPQASVSLFLSFWVHAYLYVPISVCVYVYRYTYVMCACVRVHKTSCAQCNPFFI